MMRTTFYRMPDNLKDVIEDFDLTSKVHLELLQKKGDVFLFRLTRYGTVKEVVFRLAGKVSSGSDGRSGQAVADTALNAEENFLRSLGRVEIYPLFSKGKLYFDSECLVVFGKSGAEVVQFLPVFEKTEAGREPFEAGTVAVARPDEQLKCGIAKRFCLANVDGRITERVLRLVDTVPVELLNELGRLFLEDDNSCLRKTVFKEKLKEDKEMMDELSLLNRTLQVSDTKHLPVGILLLLEATGFDSNRFFHPERLNRKCRNEYYENFGKLPYKAKRKLGKVIFSSVDEFRNFVASNATD